MTPDERWQQARPQLSEIEERYRRERLRTGPRAQPSGEAYERLVDLAEQAVDAYLQGSDTLRAEIRRFFKDSYCVVRGLWGVAGRSFAAMAQDNAVVCLRKALAALSAEDFHIDYRDTADVLVDLYGKAQSLGLDPAIYFRETAGLSSGAARHPEWDSMAQFLSTFRESSIFQEAIGRKSRRWKVS